MIIYACLVLQGIYISTLNVEITATPTAPAAAAPSRFYHTPLDVNKGRIWMFKGISKIRLLLPLLPQRVFKGYVIWDL